jgi:hypothetical protein
MTFSEPVLFDVPVLPRAKKFLQVALAGEPLVAQPDLSRPEGLYRLLSLHIWTMAQSEKVLMHTQYRKKGDTRQTRRSLHPQAFTERLTVAVYEFHYSRRFHLLSHVELVVLEKLIDLLIYDDFIQYMTAATGTINESIRRWTDRYDFSDDDLSESNLRQHWLRHRPLTITRGGRDVGAANQAA